MARKHKRSSAALVTELPLRTESLPEPNLEALESLPQVKHPTAALDPVELALDAGLRRNLQTLGDEVEGRLSKKLLVLGQFYGLGIKAKIMFEISQE